LCNHAGLGLGRHAMNLKELHLGPRPRAAALARARDLIVSSCGKRPRGRRENHETKNTTHTNTTAYQSPKKPQKWYLPPKYREMKNTVFHIWTRRAPARAAQHKRCSKAVRVWPVVSFVYHGHTGEQDLMTHSRAGRRLVFITDDPVPRYES
jgi:hypothetical protein